MRWAGLASLSGTNLDAMYEHGLMPDIVMVDRHCPPKEKAEARGVPVIHIPRSGRVVEFHDDGTVTVDQARVDFTYQVAHILFEHGIQLVVMAGWMSIFSLELFYKWGFGGKVLNLHPALLPSFKGENAVADALEAGVKITGTTVHIATERLDEGPILAQEPVRVEPGDTVKSLHERIKVVERELYPKVVWQVLNGEIDLEPIWQRWQDKQSTQAEGKQP